MSGISSPTGLSQTPGLSVGNGESLGNGLSFQGFNPTPGPPGNNGILLEGSTTSFLMQEDNVSYILQE